MHTKHNFHYLRPIYSPETLTFCYLMPFFRVLRVFRAWLSERAHRRQLGARIAYHAIQGKAQERRVCRVCRVQDERSRQDEQDERDRQDERVAYGSLFYLSF